jgi:hypothetical protein
MELIKTTSWEELADYTFDPSKNLNVVKDKTVVFCPTDHIAKLFEILNEEKQRVIVISANSDYGAGLNNRNIVAEDMIKWLKFCDFRDLGYKPLYLPPRCDIETCRITDEYCVKMYTYTKDTFNKVPKTLLSWWSTNNMIPDPYYEYIPFGIPEWSYSLIKDRLDNEPTEDRLFTCYQNNTIERAEFKRTFGSQLYIRENLSHEEYIDELAKSKFCITLPGNGIDCYRNLEAIYLNVNLICPSSPIYALEKTYHRLIDFNLFDKPLQYKKLYHESFDLNYWKQKLLEEKSSLTNL